MGFLDRFLGSDTAGTAPAALAHRRERSTGSDEELAARRYRFLLRTAPPETIEQVHREAFAHLTDDQRALIYEELSRGAQTGERPLSSEPATLARAATRAEVRRPGTLERVLRADRVAGDAQGRPDAVGSGSMIGGTVRETVTGYVVGSALVSAFLPFDGGATDGSGSSEAAPVRMASSRIAARRTSAAG